MRAKLLVLASAIGSLGWGAVLPYQYAYAADTREWGALIAAGASSLFSVGALVAAPLAGRLADRFDPVRVAVIAQVLGAAGVASLVFADVPALFLAGMLVFGLGLSAAVPAKQVLALNWSSSADRRKIFAYKFTAESLGMAAGAFLAGLVVDLNRADGLDIGFLMAAGGFVLSSAIIALAGRMSRAGAPAFKSPAGVRGVVESPATGALGVVDAATGAIAVVDLDGDGHADGAARSRGALRLIFAQPAMRWTAVVTIALALGFYAQFESGLPAYGLTVLDIDPSAIGMAAAVNCLVIVALQVIVVKLTAKRGAPALLMVVGSVWVVSWLILSAAQFAPGVATAMFVMTYGIFAVGETIYSPVLNPLTAQLAPKGMVGQTLGTIAALQTAFSAAGPLVAGVLLGAGLTDAFLGMHLAVSVVAVFAAWRIKRALAATPAPTETVAAGATPSVSEVRSREEPPTTPVDLVRA
ncbi:Major Facilitator Superfamily protein [Agromyces sp. CF514]|uniref:MFS transporter n=1 Tax=Agromyces sp. CF514 TaxID=1881031 RepID=UPI0008ED5D6C|nr:MFS transporter [Agromyces sp. CF514]SFR90273.1 Major Facilitator Superfamily protein [Agromyces sp. CF514]